MLCALPFAALSDAVCTEVWERWPHGVTAA